MKKIVFFFLSFSVIAFLDARQRQMAHPSLEVSRIQMDRSFIDQVQPVTVQSISVESNISHISEQNIDRFQHLDFGSRGIQELDSRNNFQIDNGRFENMRLSFENPSFQHLNFNE